MMDVQTSAKDGLSDHDNSNKADETHDERTPATTHAEKSEDDQIDYDKYEQIMLGAGEPVKLRKKSIKLREDQDECQDEGDNDNASPEQMDKKQELTKDENEAKTEEKETEELSVKEKPISTFQQIAVFLALFVVLIIVNQAIVKVVFYIFKLESFREPLPAASKFYDEEPEFSEFDRLMEH